MPDHRHSALDDFLRDHTDRRAEELPKEVSISDSGREQLLELVRKGVPRARPRRRRTEYEDELEEKRIAKQSPRRAEVGSGRRVFFGFVLRFAAAAAILVLLAGIALWWMDRSSYNQANLAGTKVPKPSTNSLAAGADFFAPTTPAASATPSPATDTDASTQTTAADTAAQQAAAAPAPARTESTAEAPAPTGLDSNEYVRFATLAAAVPKQPSGVRVDFPELPTQLQKRQNIISVTERAMFQGVRIVQNHNGIELIDRSDGSFFPCSVKAIAPAAASPAASQQAIEVLGVDKDQPAILRFEGSRISFNLNKKVTVTVDAPLESIPVGLDHIVASGDASQAFETWLTHCRLFGEAVVEGGERVLFEVLPTQN
ncbi:MAG: hypothetical protein H7A46_04620 [Verrucomicrobiales bacterium]|nr:hypothetical protein [Verrucomicrobiales bacterium]